MGALSGNAMKVNGTNGLNVGDAQNMGWNQGDIHRAGTTPNAWQNLVKGGTQGFSQGLSSYGQQQNRMQGPQNPYQPQANGPNKYFYGYGGPNG
jgi:hypothetical protein